MFTDNYDSSFCFWVFEKRLTQKNCFLFCKKYGLFNSSIFLTIKFLLAYFPNFHGKRSGRQDLSISYQKQSCFRQPWRGFVQRTYTQTVLLEMSFYCIYGFLLYLNPVKFQCYRIAHVHNYCSIRSTTILWKILYLILFRHIKSDFERYLIWICLKSQLG